MFRAMTRRFIQASIRPPNHPPKVTDPAGSGAKTSATVFGNFLHAILDGKGVGLATPLESPPAAGAKRATNSAPAPAASPVLKKLRRLVSAETAGRAGSGEG